MHNNTKSKHTHIFIGGLHRSGTWLQTHCLERHPEISLLGTVNNTKEPGDFSKYEGQFLQSVYPDDNYYGGVGKLGFHPEIHLTEHSSLVTEDNKSQIQDEWNRYWDTSKQYLLEKTPANLIRTRFLQAMFPDTRFIFVMRHPAVVALAQQKWTGTSLSSLIEHWLICYETLLSDMKFLDNYLLLRYEDFIHTPIEHMRNTYNYLGLDPIDDIENIRKDGNEKYLTPWEKALNNKVNRKSLSYRIIKRVMPYAVKYGYPITIMEDELSMIINRFEDRVMKFGYSLKNPTKIEEIPFNTHKQVNGTKTGIA